MTRVGIATATILAVALMVSSAEAQGQFGSRSVGGSIAGVNRDSGLTQTGQVSSNAAIQRTETGFVGTSSANLQQIGSQAGSTTGRGQTGLGGLGGGLGGLGGGLGGLAGGLGGLGGGLGGLGGGLGGFGGGFGGLGGGFGGLGGGLGGGFGNTGRGGLGGQSQFGGQAGRGTGGTAASIRFHYRVDFTSTPLVPTVVSTQFVERLNRLPRIQLKGPIEVLMSGQTAILRGTVASDSDRDLLARLAALEPGIADVQNELTVAGGEDEPGPAAGPDRPPAPRN